VLPAPFVLLKQASEGRLSERRSHLNLQANLLAGKEKPKMIQMVRRQSRADGTECRVSWMEGCMSWRHWPDRNGNRGL